MSDITIEKILNLLPLNQYQGISNQKVCFVEAGCANNPADIIAPLINKGCRGLFIDANQEILSRRSRGLFKNEKTNRHHTFLCALIDTINKLQVFHKTDFGYSSSQYKHVVGHIYANSINEDIPEDEREYRLENVVSILMPTITLTDILNCAFETTLPILSLDLEGCDCDILLSTQFDVFRPLVISFEHGHSEEVFVGQGEKYHKTIAHLKSFGYVIAAKSLNDTIMISSVLSPVLAS